MYKYKFREWSDFYETIIYYIVWYNFKSYKYKLELSGIMPNSKKETTLIILTNDNTLTFDDVSKSLYSSNSKDSESVDFYLLSTE